MSGDSSLDIVKFNVETLRFDNKLFDFVLEEVGFLVFCRGRAIGNNRSGTLTDFQQAHIDQAGYDLVRCFTKRHSLVLHYRFELIREVAA